MNSKLSRVKSYQAKKKDYSSRIKYLQSISSQRNGFQVHAHTGKTIWAQDHMDKLFLFL